MQISNYKKITESLISVIIPIYNSEKTIIQCINSVINQTIPIHEIILVDDGSTDNSVNLIIQLKESSNLSNILLIQQKNSGPSAARNAGIHIATGDYIAFLDSDDWWLENKLEKQLDIFLKDSQIGLIGTKYSIERPSILQDYNYREISFNQLVFRNHFATSTVVIKRELLDTEKFNVNKKYSEDYELWLKIVYNNKAFICLGELTVMGKPIISNFGLSSNLWLMEKNEIENIRILKDEKKITTTLWLIASIFSILKYIRRLVYYKISSKKLPNAYY